jgi:tyrosyl-tRNA synthetase
MDVDVEMCGNDQKFNALAGRTLLKRMKDKEKFVFITTLLENPKTHEKMMSKSLGTGVFLDATAEDMFGGIMAQPDENMRQLFVDCTWLEFSEIEHVLAEKPMDAKKRLAYEIVAIYHGRNVAEKARQNFEKAFSQGGVPDDVTEVYVGDEGLMDALVRVKIVSSKSDYRRLLSEGAIRVVGTDEKLTERSLPPYGETLRIGKHRFVKIVK